MRTIVTALKPQSWGGEDNWKSETVLDFPNKFDGPYARYALGYIGPDGAARQIQGGPLVPGPWAYAVALPSVIDNQGGTGAEKAALQAAGLEHSVEVGDRIVFNGVTFVLQAERSGHPRLVLDEGR